MVIKKIFTFFITLFLLSAFLKAYAQESILEFNAVYNIQNSGKVNVLENILYDFGNQQRHGIFRTIPTIKENEEGKDFKIRFEDIRVLKNQFTIQRSREEITLKIGDPNRTTSGKVLYPINYTLSGALTYFENHDEFYWNVTGNEWDVPIIKASAQVSLPEDIPSEEIEAICFTGVLSSNDQNCQVSINENVVNIETTQTLGPKEGLTIVVGFPKGYVQVLEAQAVKPPILMYILIALGVIFGIFWFIFYPIKVLIMFFKNRKNIKDKSRIVSAWFQPPEYESNKPYTPAETGAIIDRKVTHNELTATIIDLAKRGYLKIKQLNKKNYEFINLNKDTNELKKYEQYVLDAFFGSAQDMVDKSAEDENKKETKEHLENLESNYENLEKIKILPKKMMETLGFLTKPRSTKLNDLKKDPLFHSNIQKYKTELEKELNNLGVFENYKKTKNKYTVIIMLAFFTFNYPLGILLAIITNKLIKYTDKGIEKYSEAKSLYNFLISQDEQLDFQAQNQMFFEKLLPYATAFGVEDVWAKRFKDMQFKPSEWYEGDLANAAAFSTISRNINNLSASSISTSSTGHSSGFSGGGFSGGGGGGGGGGSW